MVLARFIDPPPPSPTFTPDSLIDLSSKVYIITHCTAPTNISLATILYKLHATVYIGTASVSIYNEVALQLRKECPASKGSMTPFTYKVADLNSIKQAVRSFLEGEWRLDVLFLDTTESVDGNVMPSFLLAKLLSAIMHTTATHFCHPNPSIRVVWISNNYLAHVSEEDSTGTLYLLAHEFAHRGYSHINDSHAHTLSNRNPWGVQHIVVVDHTSSSPRLMRHVRQLMSIMSNSVQGTQHSACTLLYAGLGPDVRSGDWIIPWGRKGNVSEDIMRCTRKESEGKRPSETLYERCEEKGEPFT
jgi:retinol dehydrogenase-12